MNDLTLKSELLNILRWLPHGFWWNLSTRIDDRDKFNSYEGFLRRMERDRMLAAKGIKFSVGAAENWQFEYHGAKVSFFPSDRKEWFEIKKDFTVQLRINLLQNYLHDRFDELQTILNKRKVAAKG